MHRVALASLVASDAAAFEKPRGVPFVLAVPGELVNAEPGRAPSFAARDGAGRSWPMSAEAVGLDTRGRPAWWTLRGEMPGERGRIEWGARAAEAEPRAPPRGRGAAARESWRAEGLDFLWAVKPEFPIRCQVSALLAGGAAVLPASGFEAAVESASPFHATVRCTLEGDVRAELRVLTWTEGTGELEIFVGNGSAADRAFEAVCLTLTLPAAVHEIALAGEGCAARRLGGVTGLGGVARLDALGGDTLFLGDGSRASPPRGVPATPRGLVLSTPVGTLDVLYERFERREPATVEVRGARVEIRLLAQPRVLRRGQHAAARLRLRAAGRVAPGGGEALARLRDLDEGNVACVDTAVLADAQRLGFEARRLPVAASASGLGNVGGRGVGGRGSGALDAWLGAGRPSFGLGWRDDGDRPIRPGVPSNLEYDAARAILAASRDRPLTGIRDARAAALHWRAFDRGLDGLPWVHAPDHAGSGSEPGHVWVEGLLDVSYLTDDRALRKDLTRIGDALAVKASEADDYLERFLAWPLLALSALERTESGRGYGAAAAEYARALGGCEVGDSGALAFGARRASAGGLTFSPWLGGGLVGAALDAYVRTNGDAEAERLLGRLCEFLVEEAYDSRARGFARVLVRDESGAGGWRREGILRGVRNLPILATLARRELRAPSPARAAALRSVFQSSQADVFREPFERCHWWSLAFASLTPFELP